MTEYLVMLHRVDEHEGALPAGCVLDERAGRPA